MKNQGRNPGVISKKIAKMLGLWTEEDQRRETHQEKEILKKKMESIERWSTGEEVKESLRNTKRAEENQQVKTPTSKRSRTETMDREEKMAERLQTFAQSSLRKTLERNQVKKVGARASKEWFKYQRNEVIIKHLACDGKFDEKGQFVRDRSIWHFPSFTAPLTGIEEAKLKKINSYLAYMQSNIRGAVKQGKLKKAATLSMILMQRSQAFSIYTLLRTHKEYFYKYPTHYVERILRRYSEFVCSMKYSIKVERFYLVKPNGKLRPIGNPNEWTKMVLKGLEILMRELLRGRIGSYQHGFMGMKGCQTASREIIEKLQKDKELKVHEFDLKAFFNKVNVIRVCDAITAEYGPIGDWIRAITVMNIPAIAKKDILEEEELKVRKQANKGNKGQPIIHRFGFTQGSPLSPLLCAYALELGGMGKIKGLTMYADDGLVLTREENFRLKEHLSSELMLGSGARVAEDKPLGLTKEFKFLGLNYDLTKRTVSYTVRFLLPDKLKEWEKGKIENEMILKYGYRSAEHTQTWRALKEKKIIRLSKLGSNSAPAELYAYYNHVKTWTVSLDEKYADLIPLIHYAAHTVKYNPQERLKEHRDENSLLGQIADVEEWWAARRLIQRFPALENLMPKLMTESTKRFGVKPESVTEDIIQRQRVTSWWRWYPDKGESGTWKKVHGEGHQRTYYGYVLEGLIKGYLKGVRNLHMIKSYWKSYGFAKVQGTMKEPAGEWWSETFMSTYFALKMMDVWKGKAKNIRNYVKYKLPTEATMQSNTIKSKNPRHRYEMLDSSDLDRWKDPSFRGPYALTQPKGLMARVRSAGDSVYVVYGGLDLGEKLYYGLEGARNEEEKQRFMKEIERRTKEERELSKIRSTSRTRKGGRDVLQPGKWEIYSRRNSSRNPR